MLPSKSGWLSRLRLKLQPWILEVRHFLASAASKESNPVSSHRAPFGEIMSRPHSNRYGCRLGSKLEMLASARYEGAQCLCTVIS